MKITAPDLVKAGVMDEIVREPLGGAHADPMGAFPYIKDAVMNIWHTKCAPGRPRCGGRAPRPPACPGSARGVGAWRTVRARLPGRQLVARSRAGSGRRVSACLQERLT